MKTLSDNWIFWLFILLLAVALPASFSGCTFDANFAKYSAIGNPAKVTVWSGGVAVKVYESTGKVLTEEHSDGWYFMDKATGKLVRVSGTVTIEQ